MESTPNLQLPYIMPSQAQKHVTYNEAVRDLDSLVQLAILDRDLTAPPGSPENGDRYLVAPDATGPWADRSGKIAVWQDGAWAFLLPKTGWVLWVGDEERLVVFDGMDWKDVGTGANPVALVGVNAIADTINRLTVRSPSALFDEEGGDHRLKINKAGPDDTASVIFQSGHSGRAEFGLAGDDDWHVKVSTDGVTWKEALIINRTDGRVSLPTALSLDNDNQIAVKRHIREKLTANRTYYVRSNGSNSNDGLANSSGGAFLTITHALSVAAALDCSIHDVTIQVGDATWTENILLPSMLGSGQFTLQGNASAPENCIITSSTGNTIDNRSGTTWFVNGFELRTTGSGGNCVDTRNYSETIIGANMRFGSCVAAHIFAFSFGRATLPNGPGYTISGGAVWHWRSSRLALINAFGTGITLSGTPAFNQQFAFAEISATIFAGSSSFSGSATGARYLVDGLAMISTGGGGASFLPGSVAGNETNGGKYV